MLDTVFGLPVHPLVVHATVVVVPAAAVAVALAVLWPRFRRWAGWAPAALAVAAVVLTPLSTSSGESLEHQIGGSSLIEDHSRLADMLLWWVLPLAVLAVLAYVLLTFRGGRPHQRSRPLVGVLVVASVIVALGTLVQVVLIGHSGAKAAWHDAGGETAAVVLR